MVPAGPTRADLPDLPRTARRTLLRAGGHAAWAAPLVLLASEAPALAAASVPATGIQVVSAQFYLNEEMASIGMHEIVPLITLHNADPKYSVGNIVVRVAFPVSSFTGRDNDPGGGPPWPTGVNTTSATSVGWQPLYVSSSRGASSSQVQLTISVLKKNASTTLNPTLPRFSWAFANSPTVQTIPFTVTDASNTTVAGLMARIAAP